MAKRTATRATSGTSGGPVKTKAELAELVERDKSQITRWTSRSDWPFSRKPPWSRADLPKIMRWMAEDLERQAKPVDGEDPDGVKALRKEKLRQEIRHLIARAETAETALAKERGHLIDAGETEREWAGVGSLVRNAFANLGPSIVALALNKGMPQEEAGEFGSLVDAEVAGILRKLSKDGEPENDG